VFIGGGGHLILPRSNVTQRGINNNVRPEISRLAERLSGAHQVRRQDNQSLSALRAQHSRMASSARSQGTRTKRRACQDGECCFCAKSSAAEE
jgi:hypothetical protein